MLEDMPCTLQCLKRCNEQDKKIVDRCCETKHYSFEKETTSSNIVDAARHFDTRGVEKREKEDKFQD